MRIPPLLSTRYASGGQKGMVVVSIERGAGCKCLWKFWAPLLLGDTTSFYSGQGQIKNFRGFLSPSCFNNVRFDRLTQSLQRSSEIHCWQRGSTARTVWTWCDVSFDIWVHCHPKMHSMWVLLEGGVWQNVTRLSRLQLGTGFLAKEGYRTREVRWSIWLLLFFCQCLIWKQITTWQLISQRKCTQNSSPTFTRTIWFSSEQNPFLRVQDSGSICAVQAGILFEVTSAHF